MTWVSLTAMSVLWMLSHHAVGQVRVEAEDYDAMEGIQTEQTMDEGGGLNVGWIDAGDWLSYEVEIPIEGEYSLSVRYASPSTGGELSMLIDEDTILVFGFTFLNVKSRTAFGGYCSFNTTVRKAVLPRNGK